VNIAVIPARGGSKRIPYKNVKQFFGKPIIAYTIEVAIQTGLFDKIIVSTDDEQIAKVAVEYGAESPFVRPAEISDDHTGTSEVIAHAIGWLQSQGITPTDVCCMYPAAPLMIKQDVVDAHVQLRKGGWDFVFAATEFSYSVFRSFETDDAGGVKMIFPEHYQSRSQDLAKSYHDAGQFYWGRAAAWLSGRPIFSSKSSIQHLPARRVQDIDKAEDWDKAEALYSVYFARKQEKAE
jgi:N-acylneuraminate cytidylyltransferase